MNLPPLNALKSFEAAVRTRTYVAAAAELGVTPAAVSQQVRNLESFLGRKLFVRHNNRVALTDAGQSVYAAMAPALEDIADAAQRIMTGAGRSRLILSAIPSFAERWLLPRYVSLCASRPELRIDLKIEEDPVDMSRQDFDLRISYGPMHHADLAVEPLFQDSVAPLCAPAFIARHPRGTIDWDTLPAQHFIHTQWGAQFASHPTWVEWLKAEGVSRKFDTGVGHRAQSSSLALDLAAAGLGIALGQLKLAAEAMAAGHLVQASARAQPLGHAYVAAFPKVRSRRPGLRFLLTWLAKEAAAA